MKITKNRSEANSPKTISSILRNKKDILTKSLAVLSALLLWQIVSMVVDIDLLLVSPIDVVKRLFSLVAEDEFLKTVLFTLTRIAIGFFVGLLSGVLLSLVAGRFEFVETMLWPYMITIKSVPVASFVVIALIWFKASNLSALISFLMVLPIIYTNLLDGIKAVDKKMLQMADVFKMPFGRRMRFIWLPSVKPFLISACKISLGLAWKSGVAAELIGYPKGSVGEALYYSKLYLDTVDLFAWTVVIVILSVAFEKLFVFILKRALKGVETL
ncbi:MAG: ABC transporter permease subunit [Clostridia bacterium]|nr:ABC transporter permease subunit [Clostridia bacterium]